MCQLVGHGAADDSGADYQNVRGIGHGSREFIVTGRILLSPQDRFTQVGQLASHLDPVNSWFFSGLHASSIKNMEVRCLRERALEVG
jgi:hypothetical protein